MIFWGWIGADRGSLASKRKRWRRGSSFLGLPPAAVLGRVWEPRAYHTQLTAPRRDPKCGSRHRVLLLQGWWVNSNQRHARGRVATCQSPDIQWRHPRIFSTDGWKHTGKRCAIPSLMEHGSSAAVKRTLGISGMAEGSRQSPYEITRLHSRLHQTLPRRGPWARRAKNEAIVRLRGSQTDSLVCRCHGRYTE